MLMDTVEDMLCRYQCLDREGDTGKGAAFEFFGNFFLSNSQPLGLENQIWYYILFTPGENKTV